MSRTPRSPGDGPTQVDLHPGPPLTAVIGGVLSAAWVTLRSLWGRRIAAAAPGRAPPNSEPQVPASARSRRNGSPRGPAGVSVRRKSRTQSRRRDV